MPYDLPGRQVEPAAGYWAGISQLRTLDLDTIEGLVLPPYSNRPVLLDREIDFLNVLAVPANRVDPGLLDPAKLAMQAVLADVGLEVRPLSFFLTAPLRPYQTPDIVFARAAGPAADVVRNGLELGRYFLNETPGAAHRIAVTYLLHQRALADATRVWSPPRQALVHATLDTAIASSLQAAWYVKWLSDRHRTSRRERPVEWSGSSTLTDVLADYAFPLDDPSVPPDLGTTPHTPRPAPSPGSPRHPAYTSGHSTYAAAASTVLSYFFPERSQDFHDLADNIGMARLWDGVHWPSDHTAGARLGQLVGNAVLQQIAGIPLTPDDRGTIPARSDLRDELAAATT